MLEEFQIFEVSAWSEAAPELRGKRPKSWVIGPDGKRWLRKECRPDRRAEPAIEALLLELAREIGLRAPEGHCAQWTKQNQQVRGVVVRTFIEDEKVEFSEGAQILGGADPKYDSDKHEAHTPIRVLEALAQGRPLEVAASLRVALLDILIFDAWVGNGDRHPGNWGVLVAPGQSPMVAPMYDTAACLGAELQDGHSLLDPRRRTGFIERYISKCPSGFGDGERLIGQTLLVEALKQWPGWRDRTTLWLEKFERILKEAIPYIEGIPDEWLGPERKWLAQELLQQRLQWLRERQ